MQVVQRKICLLGDFSVGKTSLVRRYVEGRFDDKYLSTLGVKISRKLVHREQNQIKLLVWDLAGGDDYTGKGSVYLHGAAGALLVCDLTRRETLNTAANYAEQLRVVNENAAVVVVANKLDLTQQREITYAELESISTRLKTDYILTSAKVGDGVDAAFKQLVAKIEG